MSRRPPGNTSRVRAEALSRSLKVNSGSVPALSRPHSRTWSHNGAKYKEGEKNGTRMEFQFPENFEFEGTCGDEAMHLESWVLNEQTRRHFGSMKLLARSFRCALCDQLFDRGARALAHFAQHHTDAMASSTHTTSTIVANDDDDDDAAAAAAADDDAADASHLLYSTASRQSQHQQALLASPSTIAATRTRRSTTKRTYQDSVDPSEYDDLEGNDDSSNDGSISVTAQSSLQQQHQRKKNRLDSDSTSRKAQLQQKLQRKQQQEQEQHLQPPLQPPQLQSQLHHTSIPFSDASAIPTPPVLRKAFAAAAAAASDASASNHAYSATAAAAAVAAVAATTNSTAYSQFSPLLPPSASAATLNTPFSPSLQPFVFLSPDNAASATTTTKAGPSFTSPQQYAQLKQPSAPARVMTGTLGVIPPPSAPSGTTPLMARDKTLRTPGQLHGVPLFSSPPADMARVHEARDMLVDTARSELAPSQVMAIVAPPGYGKTRLLARLVSEQKVRRVFSDGIYWVFCGTHGASPMPAGTTVHGPPTTPTPPLDTSKKTTSSPPITETPPPLPDTDNPRPIRRILNTISALIPTFYQRHDRADVAAMSDFALREALAAHVKKKQILLVLDGISSSLELQRSFITGHSALSYTLVATRDIATISPQPWQLSQAGLVLVQPDAVALFMLARANDGSAAAFTAPERLLWSPLLTQLEQTVFVTVRSLSAILEHIRAPTETCIVIPLAAVQWICSTLHGFSPDHTSRACTRLYQCGVLALPDGVSLKLALPLVLSLENTDTSASLLNLLVTLYRRASASNSRTGEPSDECTVQLLRPWVDTLVSGTDSNGDNFSRWAHESPSREGNADDDKRGNKEEALSRAHEFSAKSLSSRLVSAMRSGEPAKMLAELIDGNADVDIHTVDPSTGQLPLNIAVSTRDSALVEMFLSRGHMRRDACGLSALDVAVTTFVDPSILRTLCGALAAQSEPLASVEPHRWHPLMMAVAHNLPLETVRLLLEQQSCDRNVVERALHVAIEMHCEALSETVSLLDGESGTYSKALVEFRRAVRSDADALARLLRQADGDVHLRMLLSDIAQRESLLHSVVGTAVNSNGTDDSSEGDRIERTIHLLVHGLGVDVNAPAYRSTSSDTPLHVAARVNAHAVTALLACHANEHRLNEAGETPRVCALALKTPGAKACAAIFEERNAIAAKAAADKAAVEKAAADQAEADDASLAAAETLHSMSTTPVIQLGAAPTPDMYTLRDNGLLPPSPASATTASARAAPLSGFTPPPASTAPPGAKKNFPLATPPPSRSILRAPPSQPKGTANATTTPSFSGLVNALTTAPTPDVKSLMEQ